MTSRQLFRPRELEVITSTLLYCVRTGGIVDLADAAGVGRLLLSWESAATLEQAAMRLVGVRDLREVRRPIRLRDRPQESRLGGWLSAFLAAASTEQVASLAANPRFREAMTRLQELVDAGILVSDAELLAPNARTFPEGSPARIETVAIATRDQPRRLSTCVASFLDNARIHGRTLRLLVVDDSLDEAHRLANRDTLASARKEYGASVVYLDREARRTFSSALIRAGIPPDVVCLAFGTPEMGTPGGQGFGAERNTLLLCSLGRLILMVDDATTCRVVPHPAVRKGLTITRRGAPMRALMAELGRCSGASPSSVDVLQVHETVLGRTLAQLLNTAEFDRQIELGALCRHLLSSLELSRGRIVACASGTLHSSISEEKARPKGFLPLRQSRPPSLCSATDLAGSGILRVLPTTTISHGLDWAGPVIGLDGREILPPFPAACPLEWAPFGATLAHSFEEAFAAQLPWAITRGGALEEIDTWCPHASPDHLSISDIVTACVLSTPTAPRNAPATQLRRLGSALLELGSLDESEFEAELRLRAWRLCSNELLRLEGIPGDPGLTAWTRARRLACVRPDFVVPKGIGAFAESDQGLATTARVIADFGRLLMWWPELNAAAAEELKNHPLNAQGLN